MGIIPRHNLIPARTYQPVQLMNTPDSLILTGGLSTRMGKDKALVEINHQPLILHLYKQLKVLSRQVYISAQHLEAGLTPLMTDGHFLKDAFPTAEGPLSGILPALKQSTADYLWIISADVYGDLTSIKQRLLAGLSESGADIVFLSIGGEDQPLIALVNTSLKTSLEYYLKQGKRAVFPWYRSENHHIVRIDKDIRFFANINTPQDLEKLREHTEIHSTHKRGFK